MEQKLGIGTSGNTSVKLWIVHGALNNLVLQSALLVEFGTAFLIHVDDLLFAGSRDFWEGKFLPAVTDKFNVNFSEIKGDGSSIHVLK